MLVFTGILRAKAVEGSPVEACCDLADVRDHLLIQ